MEKREKEKKKVVSSINRKKTFKKMDASKFNPLNIKASNKILPNLDNVKRHKSFILAEPNKFKCNQINNTTSGNNQERTTNISRTKTKLVFNSSNKSTGKNLPKLNIPSKQKDKDIDKDKQNSTRSKGRSRNRNRANSKHIKGIYKSQAEKSNYSNKVKNRNSKETKDKNVIFCKVKTAPKINAILKELQNFGKEKPKKKVVKPEKLKKRDIKSCEIKQKTTEGKENASRNYTLNDIKEEKSVMNDYSKYIEDENIKDIKIDNEFTSSDGTMDRNNGNDNLYHKSYEISNNNNFTADKVIRNKNRYNLTIDNSNNFIIIDKKKNNNFSECKNENIDYNNNNFSIIHPNNNIIINDKQINSNSNKNNNLSMNIKSYLINDSNYNPKNIKKFAQNILYPQKHIIDINIKSSEPNEGNFHLSKRINVNKNRNDLPNNRYAINYSKDSYDREKIEEQKAQQISFPRTSIPNNKKGFKFSQMKIDLNQNIQINKENNDKANNDNQYYNNTSIKYIEETKNDDNANMNENWKLNTEFCPQIKLVLNENKIEENEKNNEEKNDKNNNKIFKMELSPQTQIIYEQSNEINKQNNENEKDKE